MSFGKSLSFCSRWAAVFSPFMIISPPQRQQELHGHVLCFAEFFSSNTNYPFIIQSFTSECAVNEGGEKCTAVFLKAFYLCQNERGGNGRMGCTSAMLFFFFFFFFALHSAPEVRSEWTRNKVHIENQKLIFIL